jgi:hypothetical protein
MSKIQVNAIEPQCGTTLTVGASGDTIVIPSGAIISNQGTAAGFGPTGAVSWNTTKITANPNPAVTGVGYFCDTTSAAFTVTLPLSPAAGAVVGISDYANTFATNNITVGRNGSNIGGVATNAVLSTNGIAVTFVYVDATQGWIVTDSGNRSDLPQPQFVAATGGTITTCGNFKIHTFTGPGTFTVSSAGNSAGSNVVDYLVVAGGGGAMYDNSGGGGGGGLRYSNSTFTVPGAPGAPLASATGLPVSATGYPITVGSGGATAGPPANIPTTGNQGNPSIFSTITSTGGGIGVSCGPNSPYNSVGQPGGSGGGAGQRSTGPGLGGTGNTPPVSPAQGQSGGNSTGGCAGGAGGGGAIVAGNNTPGPGDGGAGGAGAGLPTAFGANGVPSGGYQYYAGGGGGGGGQPGSPGLVGGAGGLGGGGTGNNTSGTAGSGTANTGGGAGGGGQGGTGGSGGSGIVVIRYKFQ